jgi:hypothetical protein
MVAGRIRAGVQVPIKAGAGSRTNSQTGAKHNPTFCPEPAGTVVFIPDSKIRVGNARVPA